MASTARTALLFILLAGCFDSKRIVFRGEDAGAGGTGGAPASAATGAATAAVPEPAASEQAPADGARAAAPDGLQATALGAEGLPSDAGVAPSAVDASAADAGL
ncbi:MAG TPA: hypothetical protein VMG12_45370 [Polyangiaceae bacterium]|nr:hypothetical protein [Polyangiaceae bacterium]